MSNVFLRQLTSGLHPPDRSGFHAFLDRVMNYDASKVEVAVFLAALSARALNAENVNNFLSYQFQLAPQKILPGAEGAVNIVGTGGGISTFNISTAAALVASAAGAKVLKSGSAAYSSRCGSLDVLGALGIPMPASESELAEMMGRFGLAFIPPSHYGPLLKQLIIQTLPLSFRDIAGFINVIGPLLCPYRASGQLIGIGRIEHMEIFSEVLIKRAVPKTLLVHADCGMDEFCSFDENHCCRVGKDVQRFTISRNTFGFPQGELAKLAGGSPGKNALILRELLSGKLRGEARDTVLLNSAALLFLANVAKGMEEAIALAELAIDDGRATRQLDRLVAWKPGEGRSKTGVRRRVEREQHGK